MHSLLLIGRPAVMSVAMGSSSSRFFASELGEQEPLPVMVFLSRFLSCSLPRTMWQSVLLVTLDDLGSFSLHPPRSFYAFWQFLCRP